jgi:asparagine synthase (glutamine-hydrolysing)
MCGIAGIVSDAEFVDPTDLQQLAANLRHRGPDGEKIWITPDGLCGFVHLRLAILDTDHRSDQPMSTADGSATIVFNGEIYNFLELRVELEKLGVEFRTDSDTEVLLEAWRAWGEDMLPRLNGMWAFAIRDNSTGDIFFSRDRFGVKPLLYSQTPGRFAFASEMHALTSLPFVSTEIDPDVAARLLFDPFGVEGSAVTLHPDVRRLPAGHSATLSKGKLSVKRWWRTVDHLVDAPVDFDEAVTKFRELFLDAVRLRMRSDVRVGTCLSGGFDSTAVVSAMAHVRGLQGQSHQREADDWRHAFVASFPAFSWDETAEARLAADYAGVTPHIHDLSGDDGADDVAAVLGSLDDVYVGLPSAAWKIYRGVRAEGIRVSLDGHGADELMGAYRPEKPSLGFALRTIAGGATRNQLFSAASELVKLQALRRMGHSFLRNHRLKPPPALPIAPAGDKLPRSWSLMNRRIYDMFHAKTLPTILRNFDRISMAHGIEIRMPFMDWRLVVYVMSLPAKMKVSGATSKLVAREAMRGLMPEQIRASNRKVGFNSQMPDWLNGTLGAWAAEMLRRPNATFASIVDVPPLLAKVESLTAAKQWDWTSCGRIWPYINFRWYLEHLASAAASESSEPPMPPLAVAAGAR